MTIDAVSEMTNNALYVIIKVSLPVLLVSLVVGLVISIFPDGDFHSGADTDLCTEDRCHLLCLVVIGHWMMEHDGGDYTVQLWSSFSQYVHR